MQIMVHRWGLLLLFVAAFWLSAEILRLFWQLDALLRVVAVLAALLAWAFVNGRWLFARLYDLREGLRVGGLPEAPPYGPGDRLLVVAPHPDDEAVATGGQIQQALEAGATVSIVFLTSGDGFEWDAMVLARKPEPGPKAMLELGKRRMGEAREATRTLGVTPENVFFLGYPDGGLLRLFLEHYAQPYTSPHTQTDRVPYDAALTPGAAYTGENFERDLGRVIERAQPTFVLVPSPNDAHHDHQAAAYTVMRLLGREKALERVRYYVVHGGYEYPLPKGLFQGLPLYPPPRGRRLPWQRVPLTPEQVTNKTEAIRAHKSQVGVMKRFLLAFVRRNELWSPVPIPVTERTLAMERDAHETAA